MLEWEKCAVLNIDLRYAILLLVGLYLTRRINDFERRIANIAIRDVNKCIRESNYAPRRLFVIGGSESDLLPMSEPSRGDHTLSLTGRTVLATGG